MHPAPEVTNYYYASTPILAELLEKFILKTFEPKYRPTRILDKKGDASKMRGMRACRLFIIDSVTFPELIKEINERSGKVEVISISERKLKEIV